MAHRVAEGVHWVVSARPRLRWTLAGYPTIYVEAGPEGWVMCLNGKFSRVPSLACARFVIADAFRRALEERKVR